METALYLLPVTLGDTPVENVLPVYNKEIILGIKHFIVEDVRSARRFLKKVDREIDIDALTFYPLNKYTSPEDISGYLKPLVAGQSMGVISEAGCPAVADPGADVVAIAQRKNLKVVPLVGPSSIIMSVMGSGFNGQSFAFHGYLPIEPGERAKRIKVLEQRVYDPQRHPADPVIRTVPPCPALSGRSALLEGAGLLLIFYCTRSSDMIY